MGGTGSGRWSYHDKKRTVEECWAMTSPRWTGVLDFSKPGSISTSSGQRYRRQEDVQCA